MEKKSSFHVLHFQIWPRIHDFFLSAYFSSICSHYGHVGSMKLPQLFICRVFLFIDVWQITFHAIRKENPKLIAQTGQCGLISLSHCVQNQAAVWLRPGQGMMRSVFCQTCLRKALKALTLFFCVWFQQQPIAKAADRWHNIKTD